MKNKISDLRNHLFVVLEELSDPDSKYDLEKAKVIANVAQTIINSASVENQYLKIVGGSQGIQGVSRTFYFHLDTPPIL